MHVDGFRAMGFLPLVNDPSLEPSHQGGSNEWSQHMFSLRNKKNYL